jgi:hypothetical protein
MIVQAVSGPRNISTALMYSFNQRPDFGVIDEPFYGAYLASNQLDHPGKEQTLATRPTSHEGCIESILQAESMHRHLYLKNMAHHMVNVDWGFLDRTAHIFWIRHPRKVIASFAKVISTVSLSDLGLQEQLHQWNALNNYSGPKILVDSDAMLTNPRRNLGAICSAIGIDFDERMLQWQAGNKSCDGPWWPHWYNNVHKSTGFGEARPLPDPLSDHLHDLEQSAMPYYNELNAQTFNF